MGPLATAEAVAIDLGVIGYYWIASWVLANLVAVISGVDLTLGFRECDPRPR